MKEKKNIMGLDMDELELAGGGIVADSNTYIYVVYNSSDQPVVFKTYEKALAYCNNAGLPSSAIIKTTLKELAGG